MDALQDLNVTFTRDSHYGLTDGPGLYVVEMARILLEQAATGNTVRTIVKEMLSDVGKIV